MIYEAGGAAAAAIANAMKASGAIVQLESGEFLKLISREKGAPVVCATGGLFSPKFQYLSVYKGLFIYCKTRTELRLPADIERINSRRIWIPG